MRRDGEHTALSILRAYANRAGFPAFFASISAPADPASSARRGGSAAGQRRWVKRAGMVRVEFHKGKLGCLGNNENRCCCDRGGTGGISRTATHKGFHFDIGGHRVFSKSKAVEDFWTEILPDDMLVRPRSSRIFYAGKFFTYPLKPFEALIKLGIFESI